MTTGLGWPSGGPIVDASGPKRSTYMSLSCFQLSSPLRGRTVEREVEAMSRQ